MSLHSVEFPKLAVPQEQIERPDLNAGEGALPETGFSKMLDESIDQVNKDQLEANAAVKDLVAGRTKNIHEALLALEKADLSMKLMMQVRNKALEAYKEVMRMQV